MFTVLLLVLTVLQAPRNITIQGSSPVVQGSSVSLQADNTTVQGSNIQVQGEAVSGRNLYVQTDNKSGHAVTISTVPDTRTIVVK